MKNEIWIWDKNLFGKWEFRRKNELDEAPELFMFFLYMILFVVALLALSILFLISPLLVSLLGFLLVSNKRYYACIATLLVSMYLVYDFEHKIITGFMIFGYTDSDGKFNKGLFESCGIDYHKFIDYVYASWWIAGAINILHIVTYFIAIKNGENYISEKELTLDKKNENGIQNFNSGYIEVYYPGQWFLFDVKTYIYVNDKLHSRESTKKGFITKIPINSDSLTIKVTIMGFKSTVFDVPKVDKSKKYSMGLTYDDNVGKYSNQYSFFEDK